MPVRVLVAKPGLDGHDRGAKIVARALRDGGFEVIYTGIRQKVDAIAEMALQEDVDVVGLSVLSGAHLGLAARTLEALASRGLNDIKVVVGGTIPASDRRALLDLGVDAVFPTGTSIEALVAGVAGLFDEDGHGFARGSPTAQPRVVGSDLRSDQPGHTHSTTSGMSSP